MRNSQRAVATVLGAGVLVLLGVGAWLKFITPQLPQLSGQRTTRTYDHADFAGVEVSGQWQITIERGDTWQVAVDVPAELVEALRVERDGEALVLGLERGWWLGDLSRIDDGPQARITMPALESLALSGATAASFSGFEGSRLSLVSSGAAEIRAVGSRFETLTLVMSGAGNVDLDEVPVTNAEITVSGAGNVALRMAGGRLTGRMSGAANLDYSGSVSEQSVSTSGVVSIQHVD